ncbi:hypothetical protein OAO42_00070 [Candidatus Izimaplasma bacterium]|nr:hypothetical protein [Candidatus Izimaplasma bacterium]
MVYWVGDVPDQTIFIVIGLVMIYPLVTMGLKIYEDCFMGGMKIEQSIDAYVNFYSLSLISLVTFFVLFIFQSATKESELLSVVIVKLILFFAGLAIMIVGSLYYRKEKKN